MGNPYNLEMGAEVGGASRRLPLLEESRGNFAVVKELMVWHEFRMKDFDEIG
jgi:hypothetical protein